LSSIQDISHTEQTNKMSLTYRKIDGFNDTDRFFAIGNEIYINDPGESYKSKLVNGLPLDYLMGCYFENSDEQYQQTNVSESEEESEASEASQDENYEQEQEQDNKEQQDNEEVIQTNILNPHMYEYLDAVNTNELGRQILTKTNWMDYALISKSHLKSKTNYTKSKQSNSKGQKKVKTHNLQEKNKKDKRNKTALLKDGNSYKTNVRKDNDIKEIYERDSRDICYDAYYRDNYEYDNWYYLDNFSDDDDCTIRQLYWDNELNHFDVWSNRINHETDESFRSWEDYINSSEYLEIHSDNVSNGIRIIEFGTRSAEAP